MNSSKEQTDNRNLTYSTLDDSKRRLINFYRSCDEAKLLVLQIILQHLVNIDDVSDDMTLICESKD